MEGIQDQSGRRYDRQERFEGIGPEGQRAIRAASVVVIGCGALGSVAAGILARAGVGRLRLVDRDIVELHNLHRQPLFTEDDLAAGSPKAVAAARALRAANSAIEIEEVVDDFNYRSALRLLRGADLAVDGSDNFEARLLLNDAALELGLPWVYGGAIAGEGMVKAVVPGRTSCFRCLIDGVPPAGESPTCETEGVVATAPGVVASLQASLALRLLMGEEVSGDLHLIDAWNPALRTVSAPRLGDCPACVGGDRRYLEGREAGSAEAMCSSDTVQVMPAKEGHIDLDELAVKLGSLGEVSNRRYYLGFDDGELNIAIFPDGRCIVRGTDNPARARAVVTSYLGG